MLLRNVDYTQRLIEFLLWLTLAHSLFLKRRKRLQCFRVENLVFIPCLPTYTDLLNTVIGKHFLNLTCYLLVRPRCNWYFENFLRESRLHRCEKGYVILMLVSLINYNYVSRLRLIYCPVGFSMKQKIFNLSGSKIEWAVLFQIHLYLPRKRQFLLFLMALRHTFYTKATRCIVWQIILSRAELFTSYCISSQMPKSLPTLRFKIFLKSQFHLTLLCRKHACLGEASSVCNHTGQW